MKRSLIAIAVLTFLILAGGLFHFVLSSRQPGHLDAAKLIKAAKTYADNLKGQGLPIPASVSVKDLISRGLLTERDVSGLAGMEVTVNPSVDWTHPQVVLVRARLPDGHEIVGLVDGSVQTVRK